MAHEPGPSLEDARTAAPEQITVLLATANENILRALIENPSFNEKFMVPLIEGLREINASVWNSNSLTYDDHIGSTR